MKIDITPEAVSGYRGSTHQLINALEAMPIRGGISGQVVAAEASIVIRALSAANEDAYLRGFAAGQAALKNAGEFVVIDSPELAELRAALTASQAETAAAYEVAIAAVRQADASYEGAPGAYANIRALTPAHSKAALDRMIAEARAEGMREAAAIVWGSDNDVARWELDFLQDRILAAIPKGTSHE